VGTHPICGGRKGRGKGLKGTGIEGLVKKLRGGRERKREEKARD